MLDIQYAVHGTLSGVRWDKMINAVGSRPLHIGSLRAVAQRKGQMSQVVGVSRHSLGCS